MLDFLKLPRARLEQLELLLRIVGFTVRLKPLNVPSSLEQTEGWSLRNVQKFQDTAHSQVVQLQRVPLYVVPENAAYVVSEKLFTAVNNQTALANLYGQLRARRAKDPALVDSRLPGASLLQILRSARSWAEKTLGLDFAGMRLEKQTRKLEAAVLDDSDRLAMVVHDWDLALVHPDTVQLKGYPAADVVPVTSVDLRPNQVANHGMWKTQLDQMFLPPNKSVPPDAVQPGATTQKALQAYDNPLFTDDLTAERALFLSAVLGWLLDFAKLLIDHFSSTYPTAFQKHAQIKPTSGALDWLASSASAGWSTVSRLNIQSALAALEWFRSNKLNDNALAANVEQTNELIVTNGLNPLAQGQVPDRTKDPKPDIILTNLMNATRSAVAFLFLPHLLLDFIKALDNFVAGTGGEPVQELAALFAPYTLLLPAVEDKALPTSTLFKASDEKQDDDLVGKLELRHWAGKAACAAVEYMRDGPGFPRDKSSLKTFGQHMSDFGSDYVFASVLRAELTGKTMEAPEPEQLEVLLLDALERQGGADVKPDLMHEFELARQALSEYSAWASLSPPSADYFQTRPCELLRVRGLDLSAVPELVTGPRGVRVMMPLDVEIEAVQSEEGYTRLAQEPVLTPYLLSVLKSSPVFMQQWRNLVDQYSRHAGVRAEFMKRCAGEIVRDLSFD
jgi:hypothetical protein